MDKKSHVASMASYCSHKRAFEAQNDQKQLVPDVKMRNEDVDDGIQIAA